MTDEAHTARGRYAAESRRSADLIRGSLPRRRLGEKLFRAAGIIAIALPILFLLAMLSMIVYLSLDSLDRGELDLEVTYSEDIIDPSGARKELDLLYADYGSVLNQSLSNQFPDLSEDDLGTLRPLLSVGARFKIRERIIENPGLIGTTQNVAVPMDDLVNMYLDRKEKGQLDDFDRLSARQIAWIDELLAQGVLDNRFNTEFFTGTDLPEPELAGIWGAVVGSFYALTVCLLLSFPIGLASALFLEEFAPKRRWVTFIEVNINNLAAVPSIVFGLLGLAVFLNFMGMPRSAPFVGGLVLSLMTLPTIIIAARAAIRAVPTSVRQGALGLGASHMQMVFHHVVPMAMPGIMTGTIIGMAQALGETAPLLMIGMVAFVGQIPDSFFDPAVALPVQIFMWAGEPERAFTAKAAAAIVVMLGFLILMNLVSIIMRNRFETRW